MFWVTKILLYGVARSGSPFKNSLSWISFWPQAGQAHSKDCLGHEAVPLFLFEYSLCREANPRMGFWENSFTQRSTRKKTVGKALKSVSWIQGSVWDVRSWGEFQTWKLVAGPELLQTSYSCCWQSDFPYWRISCLLRGSGGSISILRAPQMEGSWFQVILAAWVPFVLMCCAVSKNHSRFD